MQVWSNFVVSNNGACTCCGSSPNCCYTDFTYAATPGGSTGGLTVAFPNSNTATYTGNVEHDGSFPPPLSIVMQIDSFLSLQAGAWLNVVYSVTTDGTAANGCAISLYEAGTLLTATSSNQGTSVPSGYANYTVNNAACYELWQNFQASAAFGDTMTFMNIASTASSNANIC